VGQIAPSHNHPRMVVRTYSHLQDALRYASDSNANLYVFAADEQIGDHRFKKYLAGNTADLWNFIQFQNSSAYEVIYRKNVYFYLDIEIKNIFDLDDSFVRSAINDILEETSEYGHLLCM
jgi:hypothetical protein